MTIYTPEIALPHDTRIWPSLFRAPTQILQGDDLKAFRGRPLAVLSPHFQDACSSLGAFLAHMSALRPQVVVEIGTASGGTLFLLSRAAAPNALLVSLDLPGGSFGGGYQAWRKPLYRSFAQAEQRLSIGPWLA